MEMREAMQEKVITMKPHITALLTRPPCYYGHIILA